MILFRYFIFSKSIVSMISFLRIVVIENTISTISNEWYFNIESMISLLFCFFQVSNPQRTNYIPFRRSAGQKRMLHE